jgi:uncharacterized protein YeaO (DUF488 family)
MKLNALAAALKGEHVLISAFTARYAAELARSVGDAAVALGASKESLSISYAAHDEVSDRLRGSQDVRYYADHFHPGDLF